MTLDELKVKIFRDTGVPASKLIFEYLKDEIIMMTLEPGTIINEAQLSAALDVSRSPIRTALDQLEEIGLIRQDKGKKARVTTLTQSEYYMMAELRMAIEGQAAHDLSYTVTDVQIHELKRLLDEVKQGDKTKLPYPINDANFHEYIIKATGNTFLWDAYELYRLKLQRYRIFSYMNLPLDDYGRQMRSGIHEGIYYAIKTHNADAARRAAWEDARLMRMSTNLFD
ncbi:MAG: GntR family transcriptional regulator [Eubacteriales bacterium]|nr:GntR family transcriptional regulator [Eubacteriales bacterium]